MIAWKQEKCIYFEGRYREGGCVFYDKLISDTQNKSTNIFQVLFHF